MKTFIKLFATLGVIQLNAWGISAFQVQNRAAPSTTPSTTVLYGGSALSNERIEGGTLRTWKAPINCEKAKLVLQTDGRPSHVNVGVWQDTQYNPVTMDVYLENGLKFPLKCVFKFKKTHSNTINLRNHATMEYPLTASAEALDKPSSDAIDALARNFAPELIQGAGAVRTYTFDNSVKSVQMLLQTEGRALKAKIELLQGPNNRKQVLDLVCSGGNQPFYAIFETPQAGNVVRIVNVNTVEFPFTACVAPFEYMTESEIREQNEPVIGGF